MESLDNTSLRRLVPTSVTYDIGKRMLCVVALTIAIFACTISVRTTLNDNVESAKVGNH